MEVRQLRALVGVLDEGTFTDAAIALGTTQASISRLVAALERQLGVRLVERTPRGALPTATGDRIATRARRVLGEVDAIARLAAQDAAGTGTEVRIGYAWSALGRHTTALQRRWTSERSGSALIFTQVNTPTAGLVERAADIAVTPRELDRRRF